VSASQRESGPGAMRKTSKDNTRRTNPRLLLVEQLEDRRLLSGFALLPEHPVPTPTLAPALRADLNPGVASSAPQQGLSAAVGLDAGPARVAVAAEVGTGGLFINLSASAVAAPVNAGLATGVSLGGGTELHPGASAAVTAAVDHVLATNVRANLGVSGNTAPVLQVEAAARLGGSTNVPPAPLAPANAGVSAGAGLGLAV